MKSIAIIAGCVATISLMGCQSAADHAADVRAAQDGDKLTVGTVQRQIKVGMTNAEVVEVLGAPNMVTTDEKRREDWVYDKIATDTAYSSSAGGVSVLIIGAVAKAGAQSTSQRTLTIIIKFDEHSRVRDFAYRSTSF